MNTGVMFSSKTDQHATPQAFFDTLNEEFYFCVEQHGLDEPAIRS